MITIRKRPDARYSIVNGVVHIRAYTFDVVTVDVGATEVIPTGILFKLDDPDEGVVLLPPKRKSGVDLYYPTRYIDHTMCSELGCPVTNMTTTPTHLRAGCVIAYAYPVRRGTIYAEP